MTQVDRGLDALGDRTREGGWIGLLAAFAGAAAAWS